MATKKAKKLTPDELSEVEALRARLAELESKNEVEEEDYSDVKIQQDEYIPVMSLVSHHLNLSTKENGQGYVKKFTKFGDIKRILYRDLLEIIESHPNFMEAGYFYIMHPSFIRQNGLDDIYSKILTKEKIEKILSTKSEACVELYETANEKQREIIVGMLVTKLRDNPDSVNLNVVSRISALAKVDIDGKAKFSKALLSGAEDTE